MSQLPVLLRPREVAALLGITRGHAYRLLKAQTIPSTKIGGAIRVPRDAWERWLAAKSAEALPQAGAPASDN